MIPKQFFGRTCVACICDESVDLNSIRLKLARSQLVKLQSPLSRLIRGCPWFSLFANLPGAIYDSPTKFHWLVSSIWILYFQVSIHESYAAAYGSNLWYEIYWMIEERPISAYEVLVSLEIDHKVAVWLEMIALRDEREIDY